MSSYSSGGSHESAGGKPRLGLKVTQSAEENNEESKGPQGDPASFRASLMCLDVSSPKAPE